MSRQNYAFHWSGLGANIKAASSIVSARIRERHASHEQSILPGKFKTDIAVPSAVDERCKFIARRHAKRDDFPFDANCEWTKFVQESPEHKDVASEDHLSVVLGFTGMLSGGADAKEVARFAADHGWLNANGQLTAAGDQLARALLQQSGTRTVFRI